MVVWEKKELSTTDCSKKCSYCKGSLTTQQDIDNEAHVFCLQAIEKQLTIPIHIDSLVNAMVDTRPKTTKTTSTKMK